jgi:hypothetical protein
VQQSISPKFNRPKVDCSSRYPIAPTNLPNFELFCLFEKCRILNLTVRRSSNLTEFQTTAHTDEFSRNIPRLTSPHTPVGRAAPIKTKPHDASPPFLTAASQRRAPRPGSRPDSACICMRAAS